MTEYLGAFNLRQNSHSFVLDEIGAEQCIATCQAVKCGKPTQSTDLAHPLRTDIRDVEATGDVPDWDGCGSWLSPSASAGPDARDFVQASQTLNALHISGGDMEMKQETTCKKNKSIYLVRHGEAMAAVEDPARPLTESGRQSVQRMARWAMATGVRVDLILHSGKLRAEQTASILAQHLKPPRGVASTKGLQPNDEIGYIDDLIMTQGGPLLLVGHLPNLGRLVAHLVAGDAERPVVEFDAAALVALVPRRNGWCIRYVNQPGLLQ